MFRDFLNGPDHRETYLSKILRTGRFVYSIFMQKSCGILLSMEFSPVTESCFDGFNS